MNVIEICDSDGCNNEERFLMNVTTYGLLVRSFPCKLNTFRKRVKNVVTNKGIEVGIECK